MCGRLNIIEDPLCRQVSALLDIEFKTETNRDLRPSQAAAIIAAPSGATTQLDACWGIKPPWSKGLLINAQAETVAHKKTFAQAFEVRPCLVPCSGWFEWHGDARGKQKYLFQSARRTPLFMAAIYFPDETDEKILHFVTLTSAARGKLAEYHGRMPLLIPPTKVATWLSGDRETKAGLLLPEMEEEDEIEIGAA
jgi:putative SOS response-associated peptidase YedK